MNLLTLADGFGDSEAYPVWYPDYIKWPEIIKLMTKKVNLINMARYGAGNEYMINCLKANKLDKNVVLVQWAMPNRLDLVLSHDDTYNWNSAILQDPIYSNNVLEVDGTKYWLSSASTNTNVKEYHNKYISIKQHELRSLIYIDYARMLLENDHIDYKFFLNTEGTYLRDLPSKDNWVWHKEFMGMSEFRYSSRYAELELGITQPIPLVQFDFIQQYLMPVLDLPWRSNQEIEAVGNMLYRKYQQFAKNKPLH